MYLLYFSNVNNEADTDQRNWQNNSIPVATGILKLAFGLPEDGKLVLKHVGDVSLICVLLKTVHLVHVVNGVLWYKKAWNGQL